MNRAEKYTTILTFAVILGCTLFFSALIYMENYHEVRPLGMTVTVTSDGYLARQGVVDYYPYVPSKSQFYGKELTGGNASEVIQWALNNAEEVYFKAGHYFLNGTVEINSGNELDGDFVSEPSSYIPSLNITTPKAIFVFDGQYAFHIGNVTSRVTLSNLGILTKEQYLSGVDF